MSISSLSRVAVIALALVPAEVAAQAPAAAVALPDGVGKLVPGSDWTVLRGEDLKKEARPTDPMEEPARGLLQSVCRTLVGRGRTEGHVLVHQPGATPTQVRVINAYSEGVRIPAADLRAPESIAKFRADFEAALSTPDNTLAFLEERIVPLYPDLGVMSLTFRTTTGGDSWLLTYYFVPSGDRLTYFETVHFPADPEARDAIEAVLRTFDGAKDPGAANNLLMSMTLGGLTGGIAGALFAIVRRRRRLARQTGQN